MWKPSQSVFVLPRSKCFPFIPSHCQRLHTRSLRKVSTTAPTNNGYWESPSVSPTSPDISQPSRPLSLLPFPTLFRSYALTSLSSYPLLLAPSLKLLSLFAHSSSALFNPDRNFILRWILKKTFYAQFCAGETPKEVQRTVQGLKNMGYQGVILAYGKEIVLDRGEKIEVSSTTRALEDTLDTKKEVQQWKEGTLKTVEMAKEGDFVGLKFSGAGNDAMRRLAANQPPCAILQQATIEICNLAEKRGVRLLFDAEQAAVQHGIDEWTLHFQRRYNKSTPGMAVVYGTYQAYLRSTPETLARHLAIARDEAFTLGVKLVRGAYMGSDPRELIWSTKEDTDKTYDGITEALIKQKWNYILKPALSEPKGSMAEVAFVLASHNHSSVKKAMAIRKEQTKKGTKKINMAYGQLMGMADEVSCELVTAAKAGIKATSGKRESVGPKAYKYLVWGSVGECLKYLLRRAQENRDAVIRAEGTRTALRAELGNRIWR
ncbi:proline dehydrogenase [Lecanora helva]